MREIRRAERLPSFEHGFTHFRLRVQPLRYELRGPRAGTQGPRCMWLAVADAARAAVPAPVRTLLSTLL